MLLKLSLRSLFSSKSLVAVFITIALMVSAIIAVIAAGAALVPARDAGDLDLDLATRQVGLAAYMTAAVVTGIGFATLFSNPLIKEKEERNIESLLATPLTIGHLWFAKSFALVVAATGAALVCAAGVAVVLWRVAMPDESFTVDRVLTISTVALVPLVYLGLAMLVYRVAIPGRVVDGTILVNVFVPGFSAVMLNLAGREVVDPTSWGFVLLHVAWFLALFVPTVVTRAGMTKEKAIL